MLHMLLLPFLPISALIIQNSLTLKDLLQYQTDVQRSFDKGNNLQYSEDSSFKMLLFLKLKLYFAILFSKNPYSVDGATHLEKFITNIDFGLIDSTGNLRDDRIFIVHIDWDTKRLQHHVGVLPLMHAIGEQAQAVDTSNGSGD